MQKSNRKAKAEMRVVYKVLGGRLPFGFMNELQVSLAQTLSAQKKELHFFASLLAR